jgi:hypothetical protein
MAEERDVLIEVMIDPVSEPISGTVRYPNSETSAFVGYAHLVAEIERRRDLAAAPASDENGACERGRVGE